MKFPWQRSDLHVQDKQKKLTKDQILDLPEFHEVLESRPQILF